MKFAADDELFAYNCLDLHATGLAWRKLNSFNADAMSLFDHALNGPALTMGLRGLRVDERAAAEVLEATWDEARRLRRLVDAIQPFAWSRTAIKPSPMELARTLYDRLRAPVQTNRDGGRTCSKEALEVIQNSAKSSEEAATLAGLALELSRLEEDRKVLVKPRGRDGRIHSGLGVAATVTSRWCLPAWAEVLTKTGWISISNWRAEEEIATWNSTGEISWEKARKVIFRGPDKMIQTTGHRYPGLFTPEHSLVFFDNRGKLQIKEAKLHPHMHSAILGGWLKAEFEPELRTKARVMMQADGHITKSKMIRFHFKKQRKIDRCIGFLAELGLGFRQHKCADGSTYISVKDAPDWLHQSKFFGPWCLNCNPEIFLAELHHWDGTKDRNGGTLYSSTVFANVEWVQTMAHLNNRRATIVEIKDRKENWSQAWSVFVGFDRSTRVRKRDFKDVPFAGEVYCAETASGAFLVRYLGIIYVTGNSSRRDAFGEGTNLHALSRRVRRIFIADPGKVLVNRDLAQAESYVVAYLANCQAYKDAHRAGNVHYHVLQKLWPGIVANKREAKDTPVPYNPDMSWYDQAKRIQHACLAPGHEVLTRSGWVPVESIGDAEEIAAWAPGLSLTWEKPSRWTRVLYDGDLVHFSGRNADQRVTPDHRLPMLNNGGLFYERRAEALPLNYGRLPVAGILVDGDESVSSPARARLVAATWADGNVRKIWTVFSLKKDRKKARLRELLAACGLEFRLWAENNRPGYEYIAIRETLRKRLGWDMLSWSLQARLAFLDELPFWDGSRDRGWRRVFNTDREGMEIIQAVAHISGFRARITKHGNPAPGHKQCWILYISKASQAEFSKLSTARTPFSGIVHCPTVSTGWFLVRHNGIVSVTGNSNYGQTAVGFARVAHVPVAEAKKSQAMYFAEFPEIPAWHGEVERQLTTFKCLTTPLGRIRHFLGRSWSHDTLKEAIAHVPQSTVSDINKIILWRIWKHLDPWLAEVLLEVHDSVLAQVPEARVPEFLEASGPLARVEIPVNGDLLVIGSSVGIGRNWGSWSKDNPEGLKE